MGATTGLLTFQGTSNFGSFFQTYALYTVLKRCGLDCEILDYICMDVNKREKYCKPYSLRTREIIRWALYKHSFQTRYNSLCEELKRKAKFSQRCEKSTIKAVAEAYDNVIIGSDLVWSLEITGGDYSYYWDVDDRTRLFSYASSVGQNIRSEEKEAIAKYLKRFEKISVREDNTKEEISDILPNKEVYSVCDPTILLFDKWDEEFDYKKSKFYRKVCEEKYILMYFPDSARKMEHDALELSKKNKYKIICINSKRPVRGIKNVAVNKPEDFLCLIKCAELVLTGSYHGTLFSVFNKKKFYYYVRSHGGRMVSLAKKLNFAERNAQELTKLDISSDMDYDSIFKRLSEYRDYSMKYIYSVVKKISVEQQR